MKHSFYLIFAAALFASPARAVTITAQDAAKHTGEAVTVEGVAHVHVSASASFLDIGGKYPDQPFTAVIFSDHVKAFGDLRRFDGKMVDVTGRVRGYEGKPEIILDDPGRLRLK